MYLTNIKITFILFNIFKVIDRYTTALVIILDNINFILRTQNLKSKNFPLQF